MNKVMERAVLPQYPEWHNQPLRLTVQGMENPYLVLEEFFKQYDLKDIRECLREWLRKALMAEDEGSGDLMRVWEDLERLVEGAWVIYS